MSWKDLHANLWYYDYALKSFGISFQAKTLAVKLDSKSIVVISPGLPVEKIDSEFGSVDFLIAPNALHHTYLDEWAKEYPKAKLYAPQRVQKKHPHLKFEGTPSQASFPTWKDQLEVNLVPGNIWFEEVSFFHKPSRTLILTDLCFNVQSEPNWLTRTFLKMYGVFGKTGPSFLVRTAIKDKPAFKEGLNKMLDRTIKQVVVAHGDIISKNCKDTLLKAFEKVA